ncbi:MAG: RNA polymerase sigma factor [Pseudorhodobacter sp.]
MSNEIRSEMIALLPRLRAYARSLTRAQDTADDLVQITCEKALRNIAGYAAGSRLDAWMFRILRNAWIDGHRARRETSDIADFTDSAAMIGEDGREVAENRLHLAEVRRAMEDLPEDQRTVLMLVCVEGLRYREVAEALDIPEGTVMSRLSRGRAALAQALGYGPAQSPARTTRKGVTR